MPNGVVREVIPAPSAAVFRLLHDYGRRLEWDTLLQAAYLTDGHAAAGLGAVSVCRGRAHLGGIALKTRYVSFRPPAVAAVRMVNRPPFFDTFAAAIRHRDLGAASSEVEYRYHFTARPRWLRFALHPLMHALFAWETRRRLRALQRFFARQGGGSAAGGPGAAQGSAGGRTAPP
jgi:Polyketide cyclase / dehydrase and lipid transport